MGCLDESVEVVWLPPSARDTSVAALAAPWIADEGPLTAEMRLGIGDGLAQRGIAFDAKTTVMWDESAVLVARPSPPSDDIVVLENQVLLREGMGPHSLKRYDFIRVGGDRGGVLIASRYVAGEQSDA